VKLNINITTSFNPKGKVHELEKHELKTNMNDITLVSMSINQNKNKT